MAPQPTPATLLEFPAHPPSRRHPMSRRDPASEALIQPNAENRYEVSERNLPLSCPMPGMHLWNSHPRVYLAIEASGQVKCPYCGAEYRLTTSRAA